MLRIFIHKHKNQNGPRKIHNDQFRNLYPSPNIFRRMKWRKCSDHKITGSKNENTINVSSVLGLIHRINVGDISEVHASSIFKVEVCTFLIYFCVRNTSLIQVSILTSDRLRSSMSIWFLVDNWGLKRTVHLIFPAHCPYWPIRRTNPHSTPASPFNVAFQNTMLYIRRNSTTRTIRYPKWRQHVPPKRRQYRPNSQGAIT
jgi:hypothetical protein